MDCIVYHSVAAVYSISGLDVYSQRVVVYCLVLTQGVTSLFGFIFWIVAARFYTAEEVGLAGAVIPAISLLAARDKTDILRTLIQA
jgi:hypothetical protein